MVNAPQVNALLSVISLDLEYKYDFYWFLMARFYLKKEFLRR